MIKKQLTSVIIFSAFCLGVNAGIKSSANLCYAETIPSAFEPITTIDPNKGSQVPNEITIGLDKAQGSSKLITLDEKDTFNHLINATDKFVQCNIRASWEDFRTLINNSNENDFIYISLAGKMADLGLFDLASKASLNIKDKNIAGLSMDDIKRFYYPRKKLKIEDELFLAEVYSNIIYNNQSSEATNELLKNEAVLSNYDYANYLVALGSYKSGFYSRAAKYINLAILQNPTNLNYQKLKAEILAENNEPLEAISTVENLKKQNLYSYEYGRKVKSLEQFILYKVKKTEWEKNYHLGYYYYFENDPSKAIRTLQSALSTRKKANSGEIYALMSEIYLSMNEFEKAADTAKKAYNINRNNPKALITLGDLDYRNKNYKPALAYYKKASTQDKKSYVPLVKEAQAYQKLNNVKKAKEIYAKVLKTYSDSWEAYYNVALLDKEKEATYLKKALAVNPLFEDAWIELARGEIDKGNYDIAQKYLSNAFYIDENDFRYYYYQGMINNYNGDFAQAKYNFKKCLKLNANYKDAQIELDAVLNFESDNI